MQNTCQQPTSLLLLTIDFEHRDTCRRIQRVVERQLIYIILTYKNEMY